MTATQLTVEELSRPTQVLATSNTCALCADPFRDGCLELVDLCARCRDRYPSALLEAVFDAFQYAMRLTSGELVHFESARLRGDWAHLDDASLALRGDPVPVCTSRGLDVRIDSIVWVVKAPSGS